MNEQVYTSKSVLWYFDFYLASSNFFTRIHMKRLLRPSTGWFDLWNHVQFTWHFDEHVTLKKNTRKFISVYFIIINRSELFFMPTRFVFICKHLFSCKQIRYYYSKSHPLVLKISFYWISTHEFSTVCVVWILYAEAIWTIWTYRLKNRDTFNNFSPDKQVIEQ